MRWLVVCDSSSSFRAKLSTSVCPAPLLAAAKAVDMALAVGHLDESNETLNASGSPTLHSRCGKPQNHVANMPLSYLADDMNPIHGGYEPLAMMPLAGDNIQQVHIGEKGDTMLYSDAFERARLRDPRSCFTGRASVLQAGQVYAKFHGDPRIYRLHGDFDIRVGNQQPLPVVAKQVASWGDTHPYIRGGVKSHYSGQGSRPPEFTRTRVQISSPAVVPGEQNILVTSTHNYSPTRPEESFSNSVTKQTQFPLPHPLSRADGSASRQPAVPIPRVGIQVPRPGFRNNGESIRSPDALSSKHRSCLPGPDADCLRAAIQSDSNLARYASISAWKDSRHRPVAVQETRWGAAGNRLDDRASAVTLLITNPGKEPGLRQWDGSNGDDKNVTSLRERRPAATSDRGNPPRQYVFSERTGPAAPLIQKIYEQNRQQPIRRICTTQQRRPISRYSKTTGQLSDLVQAESRHPQGHVEEQQHDY